MRQSIVEQAIASLKDKRPIFLDEYDFQDSLVRELELMVGESVRKEVSEYNHLLNEKKGSRERIDIVCANEFAIELKYPTQPFSTVYQGQEYFLKGSKSVIKGRYRFWKDLWRVEQLVNQGVVKEGYAIIVTNRPYWVEKRKNDWLKEFSTLENYEVDGQINLRFDLPGARKIFNEMSKKSFDFKHKYKVHWKNWFDFGQDGGLFNYSVLKCSRSH